MANWFDYVASPAMAKGFHSFMNPEESWENAGKAENEGWNQAQNYQRPFWQQGQDQYGRLNDAAGKLSDPAALQNEWSKNYETSPYAQQLLKQNQASGLDAASSMGLSGSSAALGNIQQGAGNVVAQDRQQYMDDLMKKYMAGIGLGTDLYHTGAQAGANLGQQAMTHGENQANIEYGRTAAPGKLFENIVRGAAGFAGANNAFNPAAGA